MTDATTAETTTSPNICANFDGTCIILITVPTVVGVFIILAIVIIVILIRKKRKSRRVLVHLPSPREIDLHPVRGGNDDGRRQNPATDATRELPALPPNDIERAPAAVTTTASSSTAFPRAERSPELHSPNYENVPKFRYSAGDEHKVDDDDNDSSSDYEHHHDYENNPIERLKCEEEQRKRICDSRNPHANTLQVLAGTSRSLNTDKKANSFHPTNQNSKLSSSSTGARDRGSPAACHSPRMKGYVNTSQSLEELDKRKVPQPPTLPTDPVIKIPSIERHCSPPKPHMEKARGYVNQPVPDS